MSAVEAWPVGTVVSASVYLETEVLERRATIVGHTAKRVRVQYEVSGRTGLAEPGELLDGRPALWVDGDWWTS